MKYGKVSGLDKEVSRIVYGAPRLSEAEMDASFQILDDMYSLGINTFDTAAVYGGGTSERTLFEWIYQRGLREKVVVIDKCAHQNRWRKRVTSFDIMSDISDSLAKPHADYIDIYQLHRDDESTPVQNIVDVMNRLYESGKIRTYGGSNWSFKRIQEANEYAYKYGLIPFSNISPHYSLGEQYVEPWEGGCVSLTGDKEAEARAFYEQNQMPIFSYSSLCKGFFTGQIKSNEIEKMGEILDPITAKAFGYEGNFKRLERAEILAKELNASISNICLAYIFNQKMNVFTLVSTRRKERMVENIKALDIELTEQQVKWLNLED